ncbi:hypothetical protein PFISCL1PPCAC_20114, partial [Pristionchus fissidentatus]
FRTPLRSPFISSKMKEMSGEDAPSSVLVLFLSNGKRVKIDIHYDTDKWSLCNFKIVENLEDLCVEFASEDFSIKRSEEDIDGWYPTSFTKLSMQIGEVQWENLDGNDTGARFRIGPILSLITSESTVESYGTRMSIDNCDPAKTTNVRVDVKREETNRFYRSRDDSSVGERLRENLSEIAFQFESRGFIVESKHFSVPAEILSLHSPYFSTLFFGDFKEKNIDFIPLGDVEFIPFKNMLKLMFYPIEYSRTRTGVYAGRLVTPLLRLALRFMCIRLSDLLIGEAKRVLELMRRKRNDNWFSWMSEIAEILNEDTTITEYLDRFHLVECVDQLTSRRTDIISPNTQRLITQRRDTISTKFSNHPKIRFVFPEGEIICVLFDDLYSEVISNLLTLIQHDWTSIFQFTRGDKFLRLSFPLSISIPPMVDASFNSSQTFFVYTFSKKNKFRLEFIESDKFEYYIHPFLGIVMSGRELVGNASVLNHVSVVS